MNHRALFLIASLSTLSLAVIHCSSNDQPGTDAGGNDSGGSDAASDVAQKQDSSTTDSGTDSATTDAGNDAAGDSGGGPTLTVKNYLSWCNVAVGNGAASAAAVQTVSATGNVPLTATPLNGFKLGDWHHTTGDTGSGDPGTVANNTSSASVNVGDAGACVWVCCPFTNGTGCPTTDQCP